MKSAILFVVEGGIQVSRIGGIMKFLGAAAADRAFPRAAKRACDRPWSEPTASRVRKGMFMTTQ
jgi:hypothetical protein